MSILVVRVTDSIHGGLLLLKDLRCKTRLMSLNVRSRRCLSWKKKPKNEPKNYDDEQIKCYTYFMVQIQVREEEDWGQMEPKRRCLQGAQERSWNSQEKSYFRTQSAEKSNPKGLQIHAQRLVKWTRECFPKRATTQANNGWNTTLRKSCLGVWFSENILHFFPYFY